MTKVRFTQTGTAGKLELNEIDISNTVSSGTISFDARNVPVLRVEHPCQTVEIEGEMKVFHYCPAGDELTAHDD